MQTTLDKEFILSRLNLRAVYEAETGRTLRAGENLICSPLREDRNKSLSINTDTGLWHDFGTGQGGDIISFVQLRHGTDFKGALEYLSQYAGVNPGHPAPCRPKAEPTKVIRQGGRADYSLREVVIGLPNRGRFEGPDTPDYFDTPGTVECYHSVYLHHPDILEYSKQHDGKLAGYSGPVWCTELVFDVDHKGENPIENIGIALDGTKALITRLKAFGLSSFDIAFSGNKGFHLTVSTPLLDKLSGYIDTPRRIESLARKLAGDIPGLDLTIYSTTHLIRSLNSINAKSGLYKIPLTEAEIFSLSPDEIIDLAKKPRRLKVKAYSRLFDEQFTIDENGNVAFASGVSFDRKEIDLLRGENDKQAIKALYNIKRHFGGNVEKDAEKWKPKN
jgi:hypothetical protein